MPAAAAATAAAAEGLGRVRALFRQVLRVHRDVLPGPLRDLGDSTAREEFRRHLRGKTTPAQWREFGSQWGTYVAMLRGRADLEPAPARLPEDVVAEMTPEQQETAAQLREAVQELGRSMLAPGGGEARGRDDRR
jgi:hypothetical protein